MVQWLVTRSKRALTTGVAVVGSAALFAGCVNPEAQRARDVAAPRMQCTPDELRSHLERETEVVREYYVGCEFVYVRVHCTDERCYPARSKPPCVGDVPCPVEDPVRLGWIYASPPP